MRERGEGEKQGVSERRRKHSERDREVADALPLPHQPSLSPSRLQVFLKSTTSMGVYAVRFAHLPGEDLYALGDALIRETLCH